MFDYILPAVAAGFLLDLIFGDPVWLYHPVRLIGKLIELFEKLLRSLFPATKAGERTAGVFLVIFVTGISTAVPAVILYWLYRICVPAGFILENTVNPEYIDEEGFHNPPVVPVHSACIHVQPSPDLAGTLLLAAVQVTGPEGLYLRRQGVGHTHKPPLQVFTGYAILSGKLCQSPDDCHKLTPPLRAYFLHAVQQVLGLRYLFQFFHCEMLHVNGCPPSVVNQGRRLCSA